MTTARHAIRIIDCSTSLAALIAVILLGSCSAGTDAAATRNAPPALERGAGLPALPVDDGPARAPSVNLNITLDGDQFYDTNTQAVGDGELVLAPNEPGVGPVAWAIYRFGGVGHDVEPTSLSVALSGMVAGEEYYLALADYAAGSWDIVPVTAAGASGTFSLADRFEAAQHVSSNYNLYVAVLTHELNLTIEFLTLQGSGSLAVPQSLEATDLESPDWVRLSWDAVPGAEQYEVFYKEADQPDEFYGFLGNAFDNGSQGSLTHSEFNPIGKPAIFGFEYEYKVRAIAGGEDPSPFSAPDTGVRSYKPPYFLEASDQAYENKVLLLWFADTKPDEEEWSYGIVRDKVLFDIVTVNSSNGGWYYDELVDDFAEHEYEVHRGSAEVGFSGPSPADTGSRAKYEHTTLVGVDSGDPTYADMEVSPVDPTKPAVAYFLQGLTSIYYGYANPGSYNLVVQAGLWQTMELTIHNGRPWIAYANQSPVYDTLGLKLARASIADPKGIDDWDVIDVFDGDVAGEEVAMEVIGGRLAILFSEDLGGLQYRLHYASATTGDPQQPSDWAVSDIGDFSGSFEPEYFDLADRQGFPVIVYQNLDGMTVMEAATLEPAGPQDWITYPISKWWDPGNASGIDLSFHDGQAYIAYCEGGFEDVGQTVLTYTLNWPPAAAEDWFHSSIAGFDDEVVKGASLQFYNERPWVSWSHSGDSSPTASSHLYRESANPDGSLGAGLWLYQPLLLPPAYTESRYETTLKLIDGHLTLLYVADNQPADQPYELRLARLLHPGEAPD